MENELNQVQETTETTDDLFTSSNDDGSDLFSTPTSVEDEEESKEVVEETKEETVEETEPKEFSLHVKYNGEEKDLGEEEARTLAQKGMNYDKVYEPLQKLAKLNGMEVGEYLNKLNQTQTEYAVDKELSKLQEEYPDVPEEVLKELATKRVTENQNIQFKKIEEEEKGKSDALDAEVQRQVNLFKKEYPDLDPSTLDNGVYDYVKEGYSLLEAYHKWSKVQEDKAKPEKEAKEKATKLNEENKKRSLGNTTNAGEDLDANDFFKGMDSI